MKRHHSTRSLCGFITLAITVSITSPGLAVTPVNSIQDGRIISGGTFANTADNKTTFTNAAGGGLWLKSGSNIRGVEVNSTGGVTNNGGTLQFYAPHDVVRIDGNVDVSGLRNGQGILTGNGGHVFIDAAYLYQNGTILANGINGGLVQVNVTGANLTPTSKIEAKGMGGNGGVVAINSSGPVVINTGSIIDSSGRVSGTFDTNLISIEGSLVIKEGQLRADGVDPTYGGSRGGTIRLVATGQSDITPIQDAWNRAASGPNPILSSIEKTNLMADTPAFIRFYDGQVTLYGGPTVTTSASGTRGLAETNNDYSQNTTPRAGDGGTIIITAANNIVIGSNLLANGATGTRNANGTPIKGGNGGTISLVAGQSIVPSSNFNIQADGGRGGWSNVTKGADSGDGGLIALNAKSLFTSIDERPTTLSASGGLGGDGLSPGRGGNGGLIVFSTDALTIQSGNSLHVRANGGQGGDNSGWAYGGQAGTLVSPDPVFLRDLPTVFQQLGALNGQAYNKPIQAMVQTNELLTHNENLILLTKNGGSATVAPNLFQRMLQATIRSVEDPTGTLGKARTEVINKNTGTSAFVYRNLVLGSTRNNLSLDLNHPYNLGMPGAPVLLDLPSALSKGEAFTTLNTLNIVNNGSVTTPQIPGPYDDSPSTMVDLWLLGRNSTSLGGGRISLIANGNISNSNLLGTTGLASGGSINIATTGNYFGLGVLTTAGGLHGGSIIIKTLGNLGQNPVTTVESSDLSANGSLMGGTIRLAPQNDFNYARSDNTASISANGSLQGGIIDIRAAHDVNMNPGEGPGIVPITTQKITANGTSSTNGRGGYISVHAGNNNTHNVPIEANGGLQNGTVSFTTGP